MIHRRATAISPSNRYKAVAAGMESPKGRWYLELEATVMATATATAMATAMAMATAIATPTPTPTAGAPLSRRLFNSINNYTNGNKKKLSLGTWEMMKTEVEGVEGWRGRTQRRTTLFTSRDGWDSSVGWL